MLHYLSIKNLAIVDHVEVEFDKGFNVITGETGAGKSVIIGALQLILGERADKSCIRTGTTKCEISGLFIFDDEAPVLSKLRQLLDEFGIDFEDNEIIIRRQITPSSTRSFINNTPVPLSVVKSISSLLVAVHGPSDNHGLVRQSLQKDLLDFYGVLDKDLAKCRMKYDELKELEKTISELYRNVPNKKQLADLKFQVTEISDVSPEDGEDESLHEKHERSANSNRILEITSEMSEVISDGENCVIDQLARPVRLLSELERLDQQAADDLKTELFSIVDNLHDFSLKVTQYAESVEIDPEEFAMLEQRMQDLSILKRKYGPTLGDVLEYLRDAQVKIDLFDNSTETMLEYEKKKDKLKAELLQIADEISGKRKKSAKSLSKKVSDKLRLLGFKNSEFSVSFSKGEIACDGYDTIDFQFSPNVGEPVQSLRKIASSGEISRVMLALKTVLAVADHTTLLVFDEIDANVGGTVANMVGAELAALGDSHQVLCISHLPQVAATGAMHFVVEKEVVDERTRTSIKKLDSDQRVQEISRMLGGDDSTPEVVEHAKKMIDRN